MENNVCRISLIIWFDLSVDVLSVYSIPRRVFYQLASGGSSSKEIMTVFSGRMSAREPQLINAVEQLQFVEVPPHQLAACGEFFTMAGTAILHNGKAVLHYRPQGCSSP